MVSRELGRWLVGVGAAVTVVGILAWVGALSWFGRLPGDITMGTGRTRVFIPIMSMLLVSLALSVLVALIRRR